MERCAPLRPEKLPSVKWWRNLPGICGRARAGAQPMGRRRVGQLLSCQEGPGWALGGV